MSDLVEFLKARLDEDERMATAARGVVPLPGRPADGKARARVFATHMRDMYLNAFTPSRALVEIEAKRRIIGEHRDDGYGNCYGCGMNAYEDMCSGIDDCPTLCALALPYADHRDYRDEWRPA